MCPLPVRAQKGNWGDRWDSNPRRPESQSGALPTELRSPHMYTRTPNYPINRAPYASNPCAQSVNGCLQGTGAPDRTRTCNLRLRRPLLYPVELRAPRRSGRQMVGAEGFEPPTPCSQSRCATRLRHAPITGITHPCLNFSGLRRAWRQSISD